MSCREIEERLGAWHDGELDAEGCREVEAHLRDCAGCSAAAKRLDALGAAIRRAPYYPAPAGFRPAGLGRPRDRWRRFGAPLALAAAASLVTFFAARSGRPADTMERELVSAHVRSLLANHLVDVPSSDRHTVKPWFAGKVDFGPEVATPEGFELAGGRLDYAGGRTVAALIYRRRQHIINLFTWPASSGDAAPAWESVDGYNVLHWVRGGMQWWAVSDLSREELAILAR